MQIRGQNFIEGDGEAISDDPESVNSILDTFSSYLIYEFRETR